MSVLASKKVIISFLGVGSIILAGTINDIHTRSIKFENPATIEEIIIPVERSLASEEMSKVAQMDLPLSEGNSHKINTSWEITRIVGNDEKVAFDKLANQEDAKKTIKITMELIGNGVVRINNDNEQVYRISLLSSFGTIALFKKMGDGYEILEAKKIIEANDKSSLIVSEEIELVLERALNQAKSNKVLEGNDVLGQMTLNGRAINNLSIELRNPNGEMQKIEIDAADLMDGGAFKAEVDGEEVSGVIFNNGKEGYRMTFVTGPMAGSMLNFVTKEQMDKIQEAAEDSQPQSEVVTSPAQEESTHAMAEVVEERKEVANDVENMEPVNVLSAEEIKETAQERGFAF